MPEGPSIMILKEKIQALNLEGKKLIGMEGYADIDKKKFVNKKVVEFRTWGKHFLICFNDSTIMIHLMLFGSYLINERKKTNFKLSLKFKDDEINFYVVNVKVYDQPVDEAYDWSNDIMADEWKPAQALKKLKEIPDTLICDALMDQNIFSGCGNIIKNEALFRSKIHPSSLVGSIPDKELKALIKEVRRFSFEFLKYKRMDKLNQHLMVYTKKTCPRCNTPLENDHLGKTDRRTFYCENCQEKY